jgi:Family of unknown function (DUF6600)
VTGKPETAEELLPEPTMKTSHQLCIFVVLTGLTVAPWLAQAELEVSASVQIHVRGDFETPLAAQGTWVEVGSYGRCWRPAHVAVGWRPYGRGEWVWTDCGWYWQSDEPWGWACYHYGWWAYQPGVGWVWVPGVEWAPAWVSWRVGGGYIGWAPLPPQGRIFATHPRPEAFVFVGERGFTSPIRPSVLLVNDRALFRKTSEIGGLKRESRSLGGATSRKVFINNGPAVEMVQRASGKRLRAVPITEAVGRWAGRPQSRKESGRRSEAKKAPADTAEHAWDNAGSGDNSRSWGSDSGSSGGGERGGHSGGHGHGRR